MINKMINVCQAKQVTAKPMPEKKNNNPESFFQENRKNQIEKMDKGYERMIIKHAM